MELRSQMKKTYANLDLLRSLSVLSVLIAHLWQKCVDYHFCAWDAETNRFFSNLSFTGVMFFFVHTCLVLMLSMDRSPAEHLARSFLVRRAFRIYPLCWVTIMLALGTGLTDHPEANLHLLGWRGLLANLLLVQNVTRAFPSIVGPLWSLPWEVQMYLVLPLFFLLLRRFSTLRVIFAIWTVTAVLAVASTLPGVPRAFHGAVFPPMFVSGMVAYKLLLRQSAAKQRGRLPGWAWPLLVIGLFALKNWLAGSHSFESPFGAGVDSCICLALALGIPAFAELHQGWIAHPAQKIAKYSYGVYLLHVPALIFVMRYLPALPLPLKIIVFLALTTLASVVSFHAVEDPLIQFGKRLTQHGHASRALIDDQSSAATATTPGLAAQRTEFSAETERLTQKNHPIPLVSIVTPVYNAARWLPETLASVRAQTLTSWEQILVDDGSTDDSVALIEAAAHQDARFRLLHTPHNGGPSAARNLAIDAARGRFIAFLDADDLWLPEKLARSVEWISSHGFDFIYHDYRHLSPDGSRTGAIIQAPETLDLHTLHTRRGHGGCLSIVIDRQRVPVIRFPRIAPHHAEDFCAWLQLIRGGHTGHRLPADLGRYRLTPKSRSSSKLHCAINAWHLYRKISKLTVLHAAFWWSQYTWNAFWLYHHARPRLQRTVAGQHW